MTASLPFVQELVFIPSQYTHPENAVYKVCTLRQCCNVVLILDFSIAESFNALAGASRPSTPSTPLSTNISIPSVLSSPFVDRVEGRTANKVSSLLSPGSDRSISHLHDATSPSTPPNLPAPIPQRIAGGEITRLRLQLAAEQAALLEETESRRPEYLKRTKRPSPELEEESMTVEQESAAPSLGVVDSPVRAAELLFSKRPPKKALSRACLRVDIRLTD